MHIPQIAAAAVLALCAVASSCKEAPLEERLREPENFLVFDYEDFGPAIFTNLTLGKPMVTEGVPSKKTASGWDVANVRVIVVAVGSKEYQWAMLEDTEWFEPGIDYRMVWYFNVMNLLDGILANEQVPEANKSRPRATREAILEAMGDADEVRVRMRPLSDELKEWAKENMVRGRRTEIGERLRAKGLSI